MVFTEKVKRISKPFETSQACKAVTFQAIPTKAEHIFWFFTENVTLSLLGTHCAGPNTDLPSNNNISKMVSVNVVFTRSSFSLVVV